MLSRIAEGLFWLGRYLERADDTARILDVEVHQMLEDASSGEHLAAGALLSVMGVEAKTGERLELANVTASLAFDRSQASSIVSSLIAARENASTIRETISSELWECLNATYVALDQRAATARAIGPHAFFRFARFVKERVALAAGIADGTMPRDDTWLFLILGQSVERADMTARLLSVRLSLPPGTGDWVTTLRCCSAHEAYLRTYRAAVEPARVIEFLLLDRLFPRSAYHALATAERCCAELDGEQRRLGTGDEALRILGRARADLEYRQIGERLDELAPLLETLQAVCSQASAAVASRFFHREGTQPWHSEGLGFDLPGRAGGGGTS